MTVYKRALGRSNRRRTAFVSVVAAGGLLLTACGGNDTKGADRGGESSASATQNARNTGENPAPGALGDADVMFAQMMIPHHEQALEMAKLAHGRASDAEIKTLAEEIEKTQDPEIQTMKSWLKAWGKPESAEESMPGMDHGSGGMDHSGMSGMMSDEDMEKLKAAKDTEFDRMFAQLMIDHHKGAVEMAEDEQANGKNATAKKLAGDVVKTQSGEIEQLQKILDRL